jgi:phosphoglucomutase
MAEGDPFAEVGSLYPQRENFHLTQEAIAQFTKKLLQEAKDFNGRDAGNSAVKDGLKLVFEDAGWLCFRLSGTVPVLPVYSEANSQAEMAN